MCDWCWIEHPTVPVVLGNSFSGDIRDADMCNTAIRTISHNREYSDFIQVSLRDGTLFRFDMWES
jgi:hypothetical protein